MTPVTFVGVRRSAGHWDCTGWTLEVEACPRLRKLVTSSYLQSGTDKWRERRACMASSDSFSARFTHRNIVPSLLALLGRNTCGVELFDTWMDSEGQDTLSVIAWGLHLTDFRPANTRAQVLYLLVEL